MVIGLHAGELPRTLLAIVRDAFSFRAVSGGAVGAGISLLPPALRYGISRGVFSNEAGLGAGGISAAAAQTDDPVRQGYISMTGVFVDTMVICLVTGPCRWSDRGGRGDTGGGKSGWSGDGNSGL